MKYNPHVKHELKNLGKPPRSGMKSVTANNSVRHSPRSHNSVILPSAATSKPLDGYDSDTTALILQKMKEKEQAD